MLEISNIKKSYILKDQSVEALKGLTVRFRKNEFVSILGPSGCGKTTLLNIIGGLDKYTSGDLIIDGVSTKEYKDKNWDNYRNHKIGFVFQNYNLIPHQTVLENVELALTLSGVSKKERRARATEVLDKVGLSDKLKSKPNQLSGGQMQRVAIARALVNDPSIILADEPTGALDSKTSVQIMELLKKVSEDRLVLMVTHNPKLAAEYSTRIIKLLDGELIEDSKPYSEQDLRKDEKEQKELEEKIIAENQTNQDEKNHFLKKREKKKSMSYFTALALSFKNMLTKKGRTIMISLAGSIGIVGIALILAVSGGLTTYIDNMQSSSLASYPVSISSMAVDFGAVMGGINEDREEGTDDELAIYNPADSLMDLGKYNYLSGDFVDYVNDYYQNQEKEKYLNDKIISYASDMRIITKENGKYIPIYNQVSASIMNGTPTNSANFQAGLNNKDYVLSMYDVIGGTSAHYPNSMNEVALVVDQDGTIPIGILNSIGITATGIDGKYNNIRYEDLIGKTYRLILNDEYFDSSTMKPKTIDFNNVKISTWDANDYQTELEDMYNSMDTVELTISCVLRGKKDANGYVFSNGIVYTQQLAEFYHNDCKDSSVIDTVKDYLLNDLSKWTKEVDFGNGPVTIDDLQFPTPYVFAIDELSMVSDMDEFSTNSPYILQQALARYAANLTPEQIVDIYLQMYGGSDTPTGLYFYVKNFEGKDDIISMINAWNNKDGVFTIMFSDTSAFLTQMLGTLVNIISYVLIAFAAISLVVSSVMISIITYTSVIERTKEIGILRSVGASKRDVSRVFNAETIIIGFAAGLFGILIAGIFCIPINLILNALTGISGLAVLPTVGSVVLIAISIGLTFVAGLIPARMASKKDPVKALRSE